MVNIDRDNKRRSEDVDRLPASTKACANIVSESESLDLVATNSLEPIANVNTTVDNTTSNPILALAPDHCATVSPDSIDSNIKEFFQLDSDVDHPGMEQEEEGLFLSNKKARGECPPLIE